MSEENRALQLNVKEKEKALDQARKNLIKAKAGVKAAEATLEQLSKNGADASVRDRAAEDLIQAIKARDALDAAISPARNEWLSSQARFNASNLGKQVKAQKEKYLAPYSQFTSRRGREQNKYMMSKLKGNASQGSRRKTVRRRKSHNK